MNESDVQSFWSSHPCGDHIVGGLHGHFADDYESFFSAYDAWRYKQEGHILGCLDEQDWQGRNVLEIGLGQGAESEQLIRRGARWFGLDLTQESVNRVGVRLALRNLPHDGLKQGSVLQIPWPDDHFDLVFSHGVLHHVPDIHRAQAEIHRVLRPGGMLVAMLYARRSLNYQVSIRFARRAALALAYPLRHTRAVAKRPMVQQHLANADEMGLRNYLRMDTFVHRNTDGPLNPYAKVYAVADVVHDFPEFDLVRHTQRYVHAPPLSLHGPAALGPFLGWHLWVWLRARGRPTQGAFSDRASHGFGST